MNAGVPVPEPPGRPARPPPVPPPPPGPAPGSFPDPMPGPSPLPIPPPLPGPPDRLAGFPAGSPIGAGGGGAVWTPGIVGLIGKAGSAMLDGFILTIGGRSDFGGGVTFKADSGASCPPPASPPPWELPGRELDSSAPDFAIGDGIPMEVTIYSGLSSDAGLTKIVRHPIIAIKTISAMCATRAQAKPK